MKTEKLLLILQYIKLFLSIMIAIIMFMLTAENHELREKLENKNCPCQKIQLMNELKAFSSHLPYNINNCDNVKHYNYSTQKDFKKEQFNLGWVKKDNVILRLQADINSDMLAVIPYNTEINFTFYNQNWLKIQYNNLIGFIEKENVSLNKNEYNDFIIPQYPGFKSYMDYRAIKDQQSAQYKLLNYYGYSDNGFRKVNDRYCIAVGSYFNTSIGQYIDLILENGVVIKCIMGDLKADIHTEDNNIFTSLNKCCSEFIVDINTLDSFVAKTGNISRINPSWNSPVKYIRIYDKNIFDEIGE